MAPSLHCRELGALRPYLLSYAQRRLSSHSMAEDAVQETLLAVLERPERFRGQSSLKTYLTAILRNKLTDALRSAGSYATQGPSQDLGDEQDEAALAPDAPQMPSPCAALERQQFLRLVDGGLARLPERTARAFVLSYGLELSNDEVCQALALTPANVWVMLHRARTALRQHLNNCWPVLQAA